MSIQHETQSGNQWQTTATGKDTADLLGAFKDLNEEERDRRKTNDHPLHVEPGVAMLFDPPGGRFEGFAPDGRIIYSEPWGTGTFEKVDGGWAVVSGGAPYVKLEEARNP